MRNKARKCKKKARWVDLGFPDLRGDPVLDLVTTMRCPPFDQGPAGLEPNVAKEGACQARDRSSRMKPVLVEVSYDA